MPARLDRDWSLSRRERLAEPVLEQRARRREEPRPLMDDIDGQFGAGCRDWVAINIGPNVTEPTEDDGRRARECNTAAAVREDGQNSAHTARCGVRVQRTAPACAARDGLTVRGDWARYEVQAEAHMALGVDGP